MNYKLERMWKEAVVVVELDALFQNLPGEAEENYEKTHSGQ
jgi:hypothetical protein